jgi:hypothetical protein
VTVSTYSGTSATVSVDRFTYTSASTPSVNRIIVAAKTNGADFKSCDSMGIDLETQLQRAEEKCKEKDTTSIQSSKDEF